MKHLELITALCKMLMFSTRYPDRSATSIPSVTFKFFDPNTLDLTAKRYASMKIWMDGGSHEYSFDPYGFNLHSKANHL